MLADPRVYGRTNAAQAGISRASDPFGGRDTPQAALLAVCLSFADRLVLKVRRRALASTRASAERIHDIVTR